MFKSSRFIAFIISVILFTLIVFLTDHTPMEAATACSILSSIYIGAKTLRGTDKSSE